MKVVLYTIHIPLRDVFAQIRRKPITRFLRFIDRELSRMFGRKFRFYISGLNPHAGEGGMLGREEERAIAPAIHSVQSEMDIAGPYPADTIFLETKDDADAVIVCWYHDQGLIPFKLNHFFSGVNLTLGLPFIRTSPDHGTAFDIAGKQCANADSMRQAINLAENLVALKSNS
jgi:4-hydroxythreonine-4-phosphate dehydrogenase